MQRLYLAKTKICYLLHPRKLTEADMTSGKCISADIWVCPMSKCYHEKLVYQEWNLNPQEGLSKRNYLDYFTFFGINKFCIFIA